MLEFLEDISPLFPKASTGGECRLLTLQASGAIRVVEVMCGLGFRVVKV